MAIIIIHKGFWRFKNYLNFACSEFNEVFCNWINDREDCRYMLLNVSHGSWKHIKYVWINHAYVFLFCFSFTRMLCNPYNYCLGSNNNKRKSTFDSMPRFGDWIFPLVSLLHVANADKRHRKPSHPRWLLHCKFASKFLTQFG